MVIRNPGTATRIGGPMAATPDQPLLDVVDVEIAYELPSGSYTALRDITFSIASGEFVSIVGPSGCGKTSLLNALAGLTPIAAGELRLSGKPIVTPGRDRAVVFQSPSLLPWRTVKKNIWFGLEGHEGLRKEEISQRVTWASELVGLTKFSDAYPYQLSGGMQQRVNLARALVMQPKILLLDEPFASLDAQTRSYLQAELEKICLETGITAVFVTHDVLEAVALSDRVIVLSHGPARVRAIINVDLPRPRLAQGEDLEHLGPLVANVRQLLVDEY